MSKNQETNQLNVQKNDKFFSKDNLAGIIALAAVVLVALYVISTHLNLPVLFVPDDAVEMTYPASILNGAAEEMAESMRGTDGVYRVKVNDDDSLSVKISLERYEKILDAAYNAVNSMTIMSINQETAIRDYYATDNYTKLCFTVNKDTETLEREVKESVYTARLYHACKNNLDVKLEAYYTDEATGETYLCEQYDIDGNVLATSTGTLIPPEREIVEPATE